MGQPNPFDLTGHVALITGAGSPSGIGFACAELLGSMGTAVVLTATSERVEDRAAQLRDRGIDAVAVVGDLTKPETSDELVAVANERWGAVSILVNNAGMISTSLPDFESGTVWDLTIDTLRASLRRNLETAFLATKAVLPSMVASGYGRVVMVASVTGPLMAMRGDAAYAAAKAGLVGLARAVAVDVAARGVTVNAVAPGWISTGSQTDSERLEGSSTPIGRSGTAAEVASAVAWLSSPGAGYVTGQCVIVDGGNSVAEERTPQ